MITAGKFSSTRRFDADALEGAVVHVLFDLTYAGQVFHLARQELLVTSTATGEQYQYAGDLADEIEWEEVIDLFNASTDSVSVPVSFTLPVDVPALVQGGHDLLSATGELSLWIEGTTYESRRVLLRGRLSAPSYGYPDEPITASLESEFAEDRSLVPPLAHVITEETWPLAVDGALGRSYPIPFGFAAGGVTQSLAYLVDPTVGAEILLVASGLCVAGDVRVVVPGSISTETVERGVDALGQVVSLIDLTGTALSFGVDDTFGIIWNQGEGGLASREGASLSGAGDALEVFFGLSTVPVDFGRVAAAKPYLNQYKIHGCILEGVTPFEWVTANLCPILPMSLVNGPDGLYPIPWRYTATAADAVATLDADLDPELQMDGVIQIDGGIRDIVNRFKLRYALRPSVGDMYKFVTLGDGDDTSDSAADSLYCRQSQARYGVRSEESETSVVHDPATAALILSWWARARALPTRVVSYVAPHSWGWLERGDVVLLTDSNLAFSGQLSLLESMTYREDGTMRLRFRLLDDVARAFRSA